MPFQNAFAARLHHKPEGFFRKSEGFFQEPESFFPKKQKASSEERWVRTHISFWNTVRLRLCIFHIRVLGLPHSRLGLLCLCLSQNSGPATGFRIAASILKTRTVWHKSFQQKNTHVAIFLDMYTDIPTFIQKPTCPSFCLSLSYSFSLFLLSWLNCVSLYCKLSFRRRTWCGQQQLFRALPPTTHSVGLQGCRSW